VRYIDLFVNHSDITINKGMGLNTVPLTCCSVNDIACRFCFSSDWNDFSSKCAIFEGSSAVRTVFIDNNCAVIPWECLTLPESELSVAVFGTCGTPNAPSYRLRNTESVTVGIIQAGANHTTAQNSPSPDLSEQLLIAFDDIKKSEEERKNAESIRKNGYDSFDGRISKIEKMAEENFKGDTGDPAGFGSLTASLDTVSVNAFPSVNIISSGNDTAKNIHFNFSFPDTKNCFASAVKNTACAKTLELSDVSPIEHTLELKAGGIIQKFTNLFDKSKVINATETDTGFSFTNTSTDGTPYTIGILKDLCPTLNVGDTIHLYADIVNAVHIVAFLYLNGSSTAWYSGNTHTITQADLDGEVYAYGVQNQVCEYNNIYITYEPYFKGLVSPSITKVESWGKNIATAQEIYSGTHGYAEMIVDGRNCVRMTSGTSLVFESIKFKDNTQYTLSLDTKCENYAGASQGNLLLAFEYTDGTVDEIFSTLDETGWTKKTFTSGNGKTIKFIKLPAFQYQVYNYIDVDTFILTETSTCKYLPIPESVQAIEGFGLGINESCFNYVDFVNKQFVKWVGKVDMGTLNWTDNGTSCFAAFDFDSNAFFPNTVSEKANILTDKYDTKSYSHCLKNNKSISGTMSTIMTMVCVKDFDYANAEAFKSAISGEMLYYGLKTPEIIDISHLLNEIDIPSSVYPVTNLRTDNPNGVVMVSYNADTKKYIDNKFTELQSLVLNS